MWHRPSHQYWILFWWQWALICTKAFMVVHMSPTQFSLLCRANLRGLSLQKSYQRPYSSLPNQGQGNYDKVTCQFGTHPKFRVDPDLGRLFATFHESWVLWKNSSCLGVPVARHSQTCHQSVEAWDRQMYGCGMHSCGLNEVSTLLLVSQRNRLEQTLKVSQKCRNCCKGKWCCVLFLSTFPLFPALEISTWHPSKPQAVPPEQWCNTVWIFFMAYFRWNMLQDRTTWKNRHTAVFLEMILQQNTQLFFILSRRGLKFSQTSISSNPFALTIRTIYCKVSIMLSWAPQRIYISILLSITMLDSSSSRSTALIFVVGRFSISGRSWKFGKSERITGSSKCLKRGLGFQLGILSFHSSLTIKNSL